MALNGVLTQKASQRLMKAQVAAAPPSDSHLTPRRIAEEQPYN